MTGGGEVVCVFLPWLVMEVWLIQERGGGVEMMEWEDGVEGWKDGGSGGDA